MNENNLHNDRSKTFKIKMNFEINQRSLFQKDAMEVFQLIQNNRMHLAKWLPWVVRTTSVEDTLLFIQKTKALLRTRKGIYSAIICGKEICGIVGANKLADKENCFEINFWVSKEYCNYGIATHCTVQLISFLKNNFFAEKIYIRVSKKNTISLKVAKKVGAVFFRTFWEQNVDIEEYVLQ